MTVVGVEKKSTGLIDFKINMNSKQDILNAFREREAHIGDMEEKIITAIEIIKNKAPFDSIHLKLFYGVDPERIKDFDFFKES